MVAESIEKIIEFLNEQGIQTEHPQNDDGKFNRVVKFEVEGDVFFIEWWVNQSYLKIRDEFSSPHIPFKYINVNPNSPTTLHNSQLCFYDEHSQGDKNSIFYNPIPFGCMRIPFNRKKD